MTGSDPTWLRLETLLHVQQRQIAEHGGCPGVRDPTLLESAVARPQQLYAYQEPAPGLPRLAAAVGYGIICGHPFVDGNKRTGLIAIRLFLRLNHHDLHASPADKYRAVMATAAGAITEDLLGDWIGQHCR
jgi:death-on-curing protein